MRRKTAELAICFTLLAGYGYADPTFQILAVPGASRTYAVGINAAGDVSGNFVDDSGSHGYIYKRATDTYLPIDIARAKYTFVESISGDEVTGYYEVHKRQHGFIRNSNGKVITFDPDDSTETFPESIANGWVAGYFIHDDNIYDAFVRDQKGNVTAFTVPGAVATQAIGINSSGWSTGSYIDDQGHIHGFLRDPAGSITTFNAPHHINARPTSITDDGTVSGVTAGAIFVRSPKGKFTLINTTGHVFTHGSTDTLVVGGSAVHHHPHSFVCDLSGKFTYFDPPNAKESYATGINAAGEIVGSSYPPGGGFSAYLRTP